MQTSPDALALFDRQGSTGLAEAAAARELPVLAVPDDPSACDIRPRPGLA